MVYLTDYRGNSPYLFHKNHVVKYPKKIKHMNSGYKKSKGEKHYKESKESKGKGNGKDKGHK